MAVGRGKSETPEEIYRLLRAAVMGKNPIAAFYQGRYRFLCPHRLGWNGRRQARVLCYQYGGESERGLAALGSPANWRCMAVEDLSRVELLADAWRSAPNHSGPQTCVAQVDVEADDQPDRNPQKGQ